MKLYSEHAWALCLAAALAYLGCLLNDHFWIAELVVHWRLDLAVGAAACTLLLLWLRFLPQAGCMLALCVAFAWPVPALFAPAPPPRGKAVDHVKLLQFNVLYVNTRFASKAVPWLLKQNADIIILQEVNNERAAELGPLKARYPQWRVEIHPGREAFGMALFSRLPIREFRRMPTGGWLNDYSFIDLKTPSGRSLHLYELHASPPGYPSLAQTRKDEFALMRQLLNADKTPYRALVGDLNSTIYAQCYQDLLKGAGLHAAQQGYRMEGTWPDLLPAPLRIGIDHVLASPQLVVEKREVGPFLGSDHMPVMNELVLYE
jgi:endonuclease/exonuclease/phosphatase (EEP) superfamily protein YafD